MREAILRHPRSMDVRVRASASALLPLRSARSAPAGLILAVLGAGALSFSAFAVDPAVPYGVLDTPWWAPEPWAVGAALGGMYLFSGIAAWLIVRQRHVLDVLVHWMMPAFYVQLVLTALWAVALFGLDAPIPALSIAIVLVAFVGLNLLRFSLLSAEAWKIMLPVLLAVGLLLAFSSIMFALNQDGPMFVVPAIALP
jgi:tryptophan-rich sensory protein